MLKKILIIFIPITFVSCEDYKNQSATKYKTIGQSVDKSNKKKTYFSKSRANWVKIEYGSLVDKQVITHSGETVSQVIEKIPRYTDDTKGLVQQYLEPFSILCHDIILTTIAPDTMPLINITSHYPIGSEQPAWASLFREGHYQLYYNSNIIRLFLKGENAIKDFDKYQSIVRHPINDILSNNANNIKNIEIFSFKNDYANTRIELNTIPEIFDINEIDLTSKRNPIDLKSIEEFLKEGVILEAAEVDKNNALYFYGRKSKHKTVAGEILSLSDIAVIFRSIYHYGNNSPYISLDTHEDNRYAKVNFGGHLENTRAGNVVLEADKLFKLIGTGLDPNTKEDIREYLSYYIDDFYTQDERSLIDNSVSGHVQIRYWFYPDSIGTVTDGKIGVIENSQFLADIERMDAKISPSYAVKNTINHLNQNFNQYASSFRTFDELSTVGRIMGLINWLKGMQMQEIIELDDLLSVKLPAFKTPEKTKKLLALTTASYPEDYYSSSLKFNNIREYAKVFDLSSLLDSFSRTTKDRQFLKAAGEYFEGLELETIAPKNYIDLKNKLSRVDDQIERDKSTLNQYDSKEVDNYNKLIYKQNSLVREINNFKLQNKCIMSVGGGINLRPDSFKKIKLNKNSPKIKKIDKVKSKLREQTYVSKSDSWIRNNNQLAVPNINNIPIDNWKYSRKNKNKYHYYNSPENYLHFEDDLSKWSYDILINDINDKVEYDNLNSLLTVYHPVIGKKAVSRIIKNSNSYSFN